MHKNPITAGVICDSFVSIKPVSEYSRHPWDIPGCRLVSQHPVLFGNNGFRYSIETAFGCIRWHEHACSFNANSARASCWIQLWASSTRLQFSHPLSLKIFINVSFHSASCSTKWLFSRRFPYRIVNAFVAVSILATSLVRLILLDFTTVTITGGPHNSRTCSSYIGHALNFWLLRYEYAQDTW
jgi:hypothetical protein